MNWQPIETAPKDGTDILGWREDCGILLVRWTAPAYFLTERECERMGDCADDEGWFFADLIAGGRLDDDEAPTHWTPLPDAPDELHREDEVKWVAKVLPDWTTLQFADSAFAFNRQTGRVCEVPHPDCPFVVFDPARYELTDAGREALERGQ